LPLNCCRLCLRYLPIGYSAECLERA